MKETFLNLIENSKNYTLAVAGAMPEEGYNTRPNPEIWNFNELLCHLAYGIHWAIENYLNERETSWEEPGPKSTKQEVIDYLKNEYHSLKTTILHSKKEDEKLIQGFYAILDHISHHRGQATIHLRCQNIVPPSYQY